MFFYKYYIHLYGHSRKLPQTIWHCQYHIVWVLKYGFRILEGQVGYEVTNCIQAPSQQQHCKLIELNIQVDRAYLLVMIPPKVSVFSFV